MKKILLSAALCSSLLFANYNDAGTDYTNAITKSFTEESTLQPINTVNMILDIISQTKASEFVNKGPYKALIKDKEQSGQVQGAGASSNKNIEKLMQMNIIVTRKSNDDPMIIKFWIDENDDPSREQRIIGFIEVEKGVSAEYPYGKLLMNFSGYSINSDKSTNFDSKVMGGVISTDKGAHEGQAIVDYKNLMTENGNQYPELLKLVLNVNATDAQNNGTKGDETGEEKGRGVAFSKAIEHGQSPALKAYKLALSNRYYKIQEVSKDDSAVNIGSEITKDKQSLSHKIFRYGLYEETSGNEVKLNSGYPIVKVNSTTGEEYHGYIGYWGLWTENNKIANGDTVYKEEDRARSTAYTIVQGPGKLKKFTKSSTTMNKLNGTKMYYWNNSNNTQYIITWDSSAGGSNGNFKILGTQNNQTGEADVVSGVSNKYLFNTAGDDNSSIPITINDWNGAWSEALQANIPIKATLTNSSNVSFHKEEIVSPSSDLDLVNYGHEVINPAMTDINDFAIYNDGSNGVIGKTYTYNTSNLTLEDESSNAIVINSSIDLSNSHRQWGASVGPLLEATSSSVVNNTYNTSNYWEVEQNENIYYKWETGSNDWNKFTGIKLNSTLQTFDAPMVFNYEHNSTKDINGATDVDGLYRLNYDGFSLQVPWKNINGKWFPKINIKSATQLSLAGNDYRVKILNEGLVVNTVSGNPASDLLIPGVNDPFWTASTLTHDAVKVKSVGERPLNTLVKVIKGQCVETNCGN